jgi:two-component system cell cycle sensor histidine kinase/response regulator CckA
MNPDPPIDERIRPHPMPRLLLLVFFILAVSIGASGYYYYSNQRKQIKQSRAEELSAIAELKANEIVSWRKARLGDAEVIFGGPWTAARIQQFLDDPSSNTLEAEILVWMESRRKNYLYSAVFLFDALGNIRLSANPGGERIQPLTIDLVKQASSTRQAIMSDIQESNQGNDLDIDLIAPLVLKKGSEQALVGAVLFRIDPHTSLYPLIQAWPTPSESGETLLVRREGNDVLFLNELRHRKNTSLTLRTPLTRLEVPAVQAVLGQEGTVEGVDYRGVKVLAVSRQIPDSSWWMISKVDLDEVYRPLYERAPWVIAFMGILIASAALCLGFIWRQQTVGFYQKGYQAELARRLTEQKMKESDARYRSLFENMLEGYAYCRMIFEHDHPHDFIYLDVNRAFEQLTGLKNVLGKRVTEVIPGIRETNPELFEVYGRVASTGKPETFETYVEALGIWLSISVYSPQKECFVAVFENITERKHVDSALRHSEARFRTAFDDAPVGMCLTSPAGRFLRVNQAFCQLLGCTEPDLLAKGLDEITHPDDREKSRESLKRMLSGEANSADFEKRYLRQDGQPVWVFVRTFLLRDANHQPVHFITHILDITERKRAEEGLKHTLAWYEAIFEGSRDAIFISDADSRFIAVNQAACELTGYSKQELLGMRIPDLHEVADLEAYEKYHDRIMVGVEIVDEAKILRKDGRKVDTEFNNRRIVINEVPFIHSVARDITELKRSEEELQKLYSAVEQSPDSIVITDTLGNIEYVNPKFTEITGYSSAEALGQNPRILKSGELSPEKYKELWETITSGHDWRGEFHNKKKNGELYWEYATISPIKNTQGVITHFLAIKEDLSVRKSLEEQLRQSQKMEAIGRLAGGVAHDFNNLLTAILGYSELMETKLKANDPLYSNVREIRHAGERAATLVRQLLAFSRKQVLQPKVLNLNQVVGELDKMLRRLIGEDIDLVTRLDPQVGQIRADVGQVEQVVVNLAVNSRDAMPKGGKLTIETANVELDENYAGDHVGVQPGPYVMLSVSDTGCGMDSAVRSRIFEPFFTTKETGKGTGLGLSTVYGIANQSGGSISVYSEPGEGTTFKIYLPRVDEPVELAARYPRGTEALRGTETILIVEDDVLVRKLATETLSKSGYQVLEAFHGEEALRICRTHEGTIHLLLTDVIMPGLTGRELAGRIEPLFAKVKVLYMSGYTDNAILHQGRLDPEMSFLQKPFTPSILLQKVREVLDKELSRIH